jgi:hypothetical protein
VSLDDDVDDGVDDGVDDDEVSEDDVEVASPEELVLSRSPDGRDDPPLPRDGLA